MDEMWSFVGNKGNPRWLWHAIDHHTGAVLAYVPGKIYLAGPYHGAPFSLVAVTSAVVGPFDLGTVVLRFGLNIDYQGIGSTAGRQNYMYNLIDFAATEIPYQPDESVKRGPIATCRSDKAQSHQ